MSLTRGTNGTPDKAASRERHALLIAGEGVIGEKGLWRTSPADIAAVAGVSVETFHVHFESTLVLLRALSAALVEQMNAVTDQATSSGIWKGAPARDVVEVAVRTIVDVVIDRRGLIRAILAECAQDESLANDLRSIGTHLSNRLLAVFAECTNVPARPSRALAFSLLVAVALAHHHILIGDTWSGVSFSKEQLTEEAARAICAYLGLEPTIGVGGDVASPDAAPTTSVHAAVTREVEVPWPSSATVEVEAAVNAGAVPNDADDARRD